MANSTQAIEKQNWKKDFFTIWIGQALSLLGSQLVQFALIWHITIKTGSATVLATVAMVSMLPGVFLSPIIGALVDRWNRRRIMMIADASIALATVLLAILFALDIAEIWHIYVLILVRSIGRNFHGPAMMASTTLMVPNKHFTRIQGINQTLHGGLNIISAPLGAILLEVLPMQAILSIDVVTAVVAIGTLFFIAIPQPERSAEELDGKSTVWQDMLAGLKYILNWPGMLIFIGSASMINFLLTPAISLLPLLVKNHFGGQALQLGWLESALGVGVILGGLLLGVWGGFKNRVATAMAGVIGIGIGTALMGLAPSSLFVLAIASMAIVGVMMPITNGSVGAIMQSVVDPSMQGRVFTLMGSISMAMTPIGLAFAGPLSDKFGIQIWFVFGGIFCIIMGIVGFMTPVVMNLEKSRQVENA